MGQAYTLKAAFQHVVNVRGLFMSELKVWEKQPSDKILSHEDPEKVCNI